MLLVIYALIILQLSLHFMNLSHFFWLSEDLHVFSTYLACVTPSTGFLMKATLKLSRQLFFFNKGRCWPADLAS